MADSVLAKLAKWAPVTTPVTTSLLVAVLGLGCSGSTGVEIPPIQTDEFVYTLAPDGIGFETEIPYTFENHTGGPVYISNCGGTFELVLDRLNGGQWVPAWGPFIPGCLSPAIRIGENDVFSDTLRVWGALPGSNTFPQFDSPTPSGTYRIRWIAAFSAIEDWSGVGPPIPEEYRVSNSFELLFP